MNEKMPAPKQPEAVEIHPTEDVLDAFGRLREEYDHPLEFAEKREAYRALHNTLEHFENSEMIALYENGQVPTFESLQKAVDSVREALQQVPDAEAGRLEKLLSERITNIKSWARRYVTSVLKFKRAKERMIQEAGGDEREAFRIADVDRRRIHDSLLEALGSCNDLLVQAGDFAEFKKPVEWGPGTVLPPKTAWEHATVFSKAALGNRDLIRDWAIVADRESEIKKLTGYPPPPEE